MRRTKMSEESQEFDEQLIEIKRMIEALLKEKKYKELETVKDMASYRADWAKSFDTLNPAKELQGVNDIFYFLCGILRGLGIKKSWNGR